MFLAQTLVLTFLGTAAPGWTAYAGAQLSGSETYRGQQVDGFAVAGARARLRTAGEGWLLQRLLVEGDLAGLLPVSPDGSAAGVASAARVGLAVGQVAFSLGVAARLDATPVPFSVLPSLAVSWEPGPVGVVLGVFDRAVGPLARLGVRYRGVTVSYAAPVGAEISADLPLASGWSLHLRGHGYRVFNALAAGLVVGVTMGEGGA